MNKQKMDFDQSRWPDIINAVNTPLGFFALALLVILTMLAIFAISTSGNLQIYLIFAMPGVCLIVITIVALFARYRLEHLLGNPSPLTKPSLPLDSQLLDDEFTKVKQENTVLKSQLDERNSLERRIFGILPSDHPIHLDNIVDHFESVAKQDILGALGNLMDKSKIESGQAYYYRRRKGGEA